ncbi:HEAT repeat domain-containing protein [Natribaculum luteum]|uniref:HEAT repeat domain-containing protein n=1 Tax=Natribaculum luteum TaxID=1586232 RepID=A0ABD5NXD4_9EURY|nr:HEAT repeat domain-containing protein [Natribaculum luteum]
MAGEGARSTGRGAATAVEDVHLPSILARLDADDASVQFETVQTVRAAVEDDPAAYLPTVPKLRRLLERESLEFHEDVAYCLAELAAESSDDVAPSVEAIVEFAQGQTSEPGPETTHALRCLSHVAEGRPDAVVGHVDAIVEVLETDDPSVREHAVCTLAHVAASSAVAVRPARSHLQEHLADDHAPVRRNACLALGRGQIVEARDRLAAVAADDPDPDVRQQASWALAELPE